MMHQGCSFIRTIGAKALRWLAIALMWSLLIPSLHASAQAPVILPPNALLVYTNQTVTLINISTAPLDLTGVSFWRAGGVVQYRIDGLATSLAPNECVQLWLVSSPTPVLPSECSNRVSYYRTSNEKLLFWIAGYEGEPFRPQYNSNALTICMASQGIEQRCAFHIPQGAETTSPWDVLDPVTGKPLPAGIQAAYDADQLWIGNFTVGTVLPTRGDLRVVYFPTKKSVQLWTPKLGTWEGAWDNRGLQANECIVLYSDASKVRPLLPCTVVGRAIVPEQPWRSRFTILGMREERPSECGDGKPAEGPVLCILGG